MEKIKNLLVMYMIFLTIGFAGIASAEEVIIRGYEPYQFAIRGPVEVQVKLLVSKIQAEQQNSEGKLQIKIIGSADLTGISANNDKLSRDRAEAVREELKSSFPEAQITAVPKGDQANAKQVKVSYIFLKSKSALWSWKIIIIIIPIALGLFALAIVIKIRQDEKKKAEAMAKVEVIKERFIQDDPTRVNVKWVKYGEYFVEFEYLPNPKAKGGKAWHSPFLSGNSDRLWDGKFSRILSSTDRCFKPNSPFASQITGLIADGKIKEKI